MLRGDLETTPLPDLLRRLADAKATGCVYVSPAGSVSDGDEASVALRDGAVCGVTLPGAEDAVAMRMVAGRRLSPAALEEARQAQETDLSSWLLSELLVHLGLADEQQVYELMVEQALSDVTELCGWSAGSWRFRRRERWRPSLSSALPVEQVLANVQQRQQEWRRLLPVISDADAVVSLAAHPDDADNADEGADEDAPLELDADAFALLCAVDGTRTLTQLGSAVGFTLLDAGRTVARLVDAGLVQIAFVSGAEPPVGAGNDDDNSCDDASPPALDAIAAALSFGIDGPLLPTDVGAGFAPVSAPWQPPRTSLGDPLADALARVSAALSDAMHEQNGPDIPIDIADDTPIAAEPVAAEPPAAEPLAAPEPASADVSAVLPAPEPSTDASDAARLLSQLADEPLRAPVVEPPKEPAPAPVGYSPQPRAPHRRENGLADTAALLRELSSLGVESDTPASRPAAARPLSAQHARKRKGLFGRN